MVIEAARGSSATTVRFPPTRIVLSAIESIRNSSPRGDKQSRVLHTDVHQTDIDAARGPDRLAMRSVPIRRYVTSALAELRRCCGQ